VNFGPLRLSTKSLTSLASSSPEASTMYGIEMAAASLESIADGCAAPPTANGVPWPAVTAMI
jgi:hypothetical protein